MAPRCPALEAAARGWEEDGGERGRCGIRERRGTQQPRQELTPAGACASTAAIRAPLPPERTRAGARRCRFCSAAPALGAPGGPDCGREASRSPSGQKAKVEGLAGCFPLGLLLVLPRVLTWPSCLSRCVLSLCAQMLPVRGAQGSPDGPGRPVSPRSPGLCIQHILSPRLRIQHIPRRRGGGSHGWAGQSPVPSTAAALPRAPRHERGNGTRSEKIAVRVNIPAIALRIS